MGGKSSNSTQQIQIPPEVLARYNAVNARAEEAAATPFKQYSSDPNAFVAPLTATQQAGIAGTSAYANTAQPYYMRATQELGAAQSAATPYYAQATQNVGQSQNVGNALALQAQGALYNAQQSAATPQQRAAAGYEQGYYGAQPMNAAAAQAYGQSLSGSQPYNQAATQAYYAGLGAAQPLNQAAQQAYYTGYGQAQPLQASASQNLSNAQNVGYGLSNLALNQLNAGFGRAQATENTALNNLTAAYQGAQPMNAMATRYLAGGAQAVNPEQLGAAQINQYMSPYLSNVLQGTAAMQNQLNQQAMSGQTGNAIRAGAFGGDRAGIAAANLAQQQQLASTKAFSDILNQGYGQALSTAQQQQQLGLGAAQANRAALQQAAQQALGIGQQQYAQGTGTAQAQAALANQMFGQSATTAAQQAALAQQLYGQGTGTAQAQAALAQQMFGQGSTMGQNLAALGQQGYAQQMGAGQNLAALGQQIYGQQAGAGQNLAALGQQLYGQGLGYGQAQQSLGQQLFGQGATTSQQLAALGQQQFGQGITAAQQQAALGAGLYGMGSQTAQGFANLGTGAQAAGLQGAQAQLAAGQAEQQTQQAGLTALYNQFLQQQSYPFQVAQFLANIAEGTGALSGSTTTTNQVLSDKRLKENIKPIGKTFDGQNIYSYNFKGQPQTEIGLIAQEVEKRHPEAIGLAGGYRTVNYDKATDEAADRGHFAYGGSAMGGGVMPQHAGEGFYDGGYVGFDPALMQQILASYQQMYAPMQNQKGGLGAVGYVPEASGSVGQLMTPGDLPAMPSATDNINSWVNTATGLEGLAKDFGWQPSSKKKKNVTPSGQARGGLAGGRNGYATDGSVDDEIVVEGRKEAPPPAPKKIEVPSATPAPAPMAQVAKVDTSKTLQRPAFQKVGLDIPQVGNTVGLPVAPGLSSLKDSTGDILSGIGSIASAFASDRRLKENIKAVGKTFDGQTVYSYNYKGDPQTRIGLIAQEVAKHHPDAVHKVGGYGAVDYKKATGDAAHRGHFAFGGSPDDEDTGAPGLNIPLQGNQVGLAGAAGLDPLKDSTGDILSGLGSIGQAAAKFMKKAEGGEVEEDENPIHEYLMRKLNPLRIPDDGEEMDSEKLWGIGEMPKQEESVGLAPARRPIKALTPPAPSKPDAGLAAASAPVQFEPTARKSGASGTKVDPEIISFFVDKGLTKEQALGIAAGIAAESANNPTALNKKSGAMGLGQWLGSRKSGILNRFGPNPSKDEQLEYLWGELTGGDKGGAAVLAQKDPKSVLHAYVTRFMRPAAGYETESDISRGHSAMGYAAGGLAGRHGYATDGTVNDIPPEVAAALDAMKAEQDKKEGRAPTSASTTPAPQATAAGLAGAPAPASVPAPQATSAGLAGASVPTAAPAQPEKAAPKKRGFLGNIAHGDFISGLGEGRATSWIPLLTGIGASMSGPYRGVVGLGQGIAAGAQAAQAQREYARELRATAAQEKVAGAQGAGAMTERLAELRSQYAQAVKDMFIVPGAYERAMNLQKQLAALGENVELPTSPQASGATIPSAQGAAPVQGATPATPGAAGPAAQAVTPADVAKARDIIQNSSNHSLEEIQNLAVRLGNYPELASGLQNIITNAMAGKRIVGNDIQNVGLGAQAQRGLAEGSVEQAVNTQNALDDAYQATVSALPQLQNLEHAADELAKTNWQTAPITQRAAPYAATLNAISNFFGFGNVVDPGAVSNIEELNKASATLRNNLTNAFRGTAGAEVVGQLGETVATADLSPQGIRKIISVMRQSMLAGRDQKEYIDNYVAQHAQDPMSLRRAFTEYNKSHPVGYWSKRAQIDYDLANDPGAVAMIKKGMNFKVDKQGHTVAQYLERKYGKGYAKVVAEVLQNMGD